MSLERFHYKIQVRESKNIFTRVLKGHIAVSNFKIKDSTSGSQIDFEARKYLKKNWIRLFSRNWSRGWIFFKCT